MAPRTRRPKAGSDVTMQDAPQPTPNNPPVIPPRTVPIQPLPARDPIDLGSNRDDPTGQRYEAYWKTLRRECGQCGTVGYKKHVYTKFEKAFEPPGLGERSNQGVLSANRSPRPEIPFRNLQNAIQRFCHLVVPDPEMERQQQQELRGIFDPHTPPRGVRTPRPSMPPKTLRPWGGLPDGVTARLLKWAPDEYFLVSIWNSEFSEYKWAILEAWIWHYLQDCNFLPSRVKDHDDDQDDDPNEPDNLNDDPALLLPTNRPSNLDGLDPPLRTRSAAHQAWNVLLEEFAPRRNYPGIHPITMNSHEDRAHVSNEQHAIAYDIWRKATLALMPRTTITSEFPFQVRDVIAHLARHLTHILGEDVFPRREILDFASETMKNYYRSPKKNLNPYDNPSEQEIEILRRRNITNALIEIVDNAIDFRNQRDRDVRSWEVFFRSPSTAATWEHDKTAPPHSFPLEDSMMDIIVDSRSPAAILANVGPSTSPGKGKGKEKATYPSPTTKWTVAWVATPTLYENRYVRTGYYVYDQYMFNNLAVVLRGTATTKTKLQNIEMERDAWGQFRDKPQDISPTSTKHDDSGEDSMLSSEGEDAVRRKAKRAAKRAGKKAKPKTPEKGTKRPGAVTAEPGDVDMETGSTAKRVRTKSPDRAPESPAKQARQRKLSRAARLERERQEQDAALLQERRDRGRSTWQRINHRREQQGLEPLAEPEDFANFEDPDGINRPRFFGGWR